MQAEAVHDYRQQCRQDEAAGGGHVGPGHVLVALDHMVQIDQVTARHGQQATEPIDLGRSPAAPHEETLARAEHGEAECGEQQDGK
ncbi:hypothetical protein D3C80_1900110 [compost metagenome]